MSSSQQRVGRFTLIQQWMAATVLALIPLLVAVSYATYAFQQQSKKQRQIIQNNEVYSHRSNAVSATTTELVRLVRQYQLLNNPSFLELSSQKKETLKGHIDALKSSLPGAEHKALLNSFDDVLNQAFSILGGTPPMNEKLLAEQLQSLVVLSEHLIVEVNRYQQDALQNGEAEFNLILDRLFLFSMLTLLGTILLMIGGTYTVSRPIWRLSEAIQTLGAQDWDHPIKIHGPSDLVALGDNLDWMRQQMQRTEQQKTAFIQHVTHELKTPLAAIIEAGNLLNEEVSGPLVKGQQEILKILRTNSRTLLGLIEQLLNYNAVSYGITTQLDPVAMMPLCESIRLGLESASPNKSIKWEFKGHPDKVISDGRLIEMILKNLIGNAVQFSPNGGRIGVYWEINDGQWQLSVVDEGPGIAEEEIERIFEPFFKGRSGQEDRVPKNGIGLAIVNVCVKLLEGEIAVHSVLSKGTTFKIFFPVARQV